MRRIVKNIIVPILLIAVTVFFAIKITPFIRDVFLASGLVHEEIYIAGTGSMYPTFPKGTGSSDIIRAGETVAWPKMRKFPSGIDIFGTTLLGHTISQGDIVEFENKKTKEITQKKYNDEAGFVKRVIAVAGDTLELSDGFVYLNGSILNEPYIAKSRSTYGGDFLPDCRKLTIADNTVFVMGDNRKASLDSRFELGLIDIQDIKFVMPWNNQQDYKKNWRDTSADTRQAQTVTLNANEFVKLVNIKRSEKDLKPYIYNSLLSLSSKRRGYVMINTNDFSSEATKSGITLAKAVKEVGYRNIVFAESFVRGFYEAEELIENFLAFPQTQDLLFSSLYQDVGLSAVLGNIDGCPVQVVVMHLGGYIPPSYTREELDGWVGVVENISSVLPSWQSLRLAENIDQGQLEQLIHRLITRKENASKIITRIQANQWLTDEEQQLVKDDKKLVDEAQEIISKLSKR